MFSGHETTGNKTYPGENDNDKLSPPWMVAGAVALGGLALAASSGEKASPPEKVDPANESTPAPIVYELEQPIDYGEGTLFTLSEETAPEGQSDELDEQGSPPIEPLNPESLIQPDGN